MKSWIHIDTQKSKGPIKKNSHHHRPLIITENFKDTNSLLKKLAIPTFLYINSTLG